MRLILHKRSHTLSHTLAIRISFQIYKHNQPSETLFSSSVSCCRPNKSHVSFHQVRVRWMGTTQHVHHVSRRRRTTCRQRAWKDGVPSGTQGPAGAWSSTCAMMVGLFVLGPQRAWRPHIMHVRAGLKQRLAPVRAVREFLCCVCVILFNLEISVSKEKKAGKPTEKVDFQQIFHWCRHVGMYTQENSGKQRLMKIFVLFIYLKKILILKNRPETLRFWLGSEVSMLCRPCRGVCPGKRGRAAWFGIFFEKSGLGKWGFYRLGFNGI